MKRGEDFLVRAAHGPASMGTSTSLALDFHSNEVSVWWSSGQYLGEVSSYQGEDIVEPTTTTRFSELETVTPTLLSRSTNVLQPYCNRASTH
jgi:hypothetical protein